ncbi:DUF1127 domain-containing protein [Rhizobium sp. RU36D]|uniref:DUF1127 domain-containing protein n=1 Tax=Rhizobium sp. RU36D TaxID=1907415 RepID=UPI0009FC6B40|nr:DUF1127 domain-containing protein [Rhizobium sp. RU36D]
MTRQPRRSSHTAAFLQTSVSAAERLGRWWQQRRQLRALESMPADLRKDIGWPGADRLNPSRR